jgi:hypothetical protein
MFSVALRAFLALYLPLVSILWASISYAAPIDNQEVEHLSVPIVNLPTDEAAEAFVKPIIAKYRPRFAAGLADEDWDREIEPIIVMHVGNSIPDPLKWALMKLEAVKIPAKVELIDESKLDTQIAIAQAAAAEGATHLTFDRDLYKEREQGVKTEWKDVKHRAFKIFGLPNGFTTWLIAERTARKKFVDGSLATLSSALAGASTAFTFYLTAKNGSPEVAPNILQAGLFVATWTWFQVYNVQAITDIMTRSKAVKQTAKNVFEAKSSLLSSTLTTTLRSLLTNAMIVVAAYGLDGLVTSYNFEAALLNTAVNIFARGWVDDLIDAKAPTFKHDGTVVVDVKKKQWELATWLFFKHGWTLLYQFGKNAHLLSGVAGTPTWMNVIYYSFGAIGLGVMGYKERYNIQYRLQRAVAYLRGEPKDYCQSLLVDPTAVVESVRAF